MLTGKKQGQTGLAEKRNWRQILNGKDQQYLKNEDWDWLQEDKETVIRRHV